METGGTGAEKVCAWFPLLLCVVWKHELLRDGICAVNTFRNCIWSPAFLLQRLQSISVFLSVYSTSPLD